MFGERGTDIGDRASRVGAVDVEKMRERQTDNDVDELPARSARGMRDHQAENECLIFGAGQPTDTLAYCTESSLQKLRRCANPWKIENATPSAPCHFCHVVCLTERQRGTLTLLVDLPEREEENKLLSSRPIGLMVQGSIVHF